MVACVENGCTFFRFAERKERKFVDLVVKKETQSLGMIKVEFSLSVQIPKKIDNAHTSIFQK